MRKGQMYLGAITLIKVSGARIVGKAGLNIVVSKLIARRINDGGGGS